MLIIPAIDIRGGKCVRLIQGNYSRETVYGEDPALMADRWIAEGAEYLHVVDLDGAREGIPRNKGKIREIVKRVKIPVEVGGGIRDLATVEEYLSSGLKRVILGTAAFVDPLFLETACSRWPGSIAVDIAAKNGYVAIAGWEQETGVRAVDWAEKCASSGAAVIIYTDVLRDGTQQGVNIQATKEMAQALSIPVIASGGISSLKDIQALCPLEKEGVVGAIVGKALYDGSLSLPEAIAYLKEKKAC
ncbi:MAG: 1-(5-phosphoribosyl)-5-[(5-phosphoribosylamino)methylideneamino]imidazole-4-carboxamide isomerase [Deltaproteobacteria bacterium]|nr:1-(5-phosphoribosyl)-5-[(5-phosphoribosylamino)methylideneamino]imidazole-4-carboxamide isomerase [Deltaproteobacteria bacterium]